MLKRMWEAEFTKEVETTGLFRFKIRRLIRLNLMVLLLSSPALIHSYNLFSPIIRVQKFNVTSQSLEFKLQAEQIIINSEKVFSDSLLYDKEFYKIDYQKGVILFSEPIGLVIVEYKTIPENMKEKFYLFLEQTYTDSIVIAKTVNRYSLFAGDTNLNISGSKTIAVSIANDEDFKLNQSLFLRLDGEISNNLNIEAQLSDSQSPITPEGDSREISSFDKIFLRLYSKHYQLAFGDLEMDFTDTEFMNYSPQFEGLKAAWQDRHDISAALAISKGKRTTVRFNGVDGKQGPYYLNADGLSGLMVVPGSEEVFLNGIRMQRGDDYVIDYTEGSITFSNLHFISASYRIQVSLQYSDENYRQNMYLNSSTFNLTEKIQLSNAMIIQNDDKNNPLQEELSEEDIEALKQAGDDQVWVSGIVETEDGLYNFSDEGYYYYVGNDSTVTGSYNIYFEYTGSGNGDYNYEPGGGYFVFSGSGQGEYMPIRKLTAPERLANYDISLKYSTAELSLKAEGIVSQYDRNTFSSYDDNDNNGYAADMNLIYNPVVKELKPEIELRYRRIGENLQTFADLQSAADVYEFDQIPDTLASSSYSGKASLLLFKHYQPQITFKRTSAADYAVQDYLSFSSRILPGKYIPDFFHRYFNMSQVFENNQISEYRVDQHYIKSSCDLSVFNLNFGFLEKTSERIFQTADNISLYRNLDLNLELKKIRSIYSGLFLKMEKTRTSLQTDSTDVVQDHKRTTTAGINLKLNTDRQRFDISYSHQEVDNLVMKDKKAFHLAAISSNNVFFKRAIHLNSNYSLKNVEFYPKIREFLFVGESLGSYDIDTLYVGFGEGDYNWEITRIDYENPQMSIEVNASLNINLNPQIITENYLSRFRTETFLQVYENSTDTADAGVYFLDPLSLMNEQTSLYGRQIFQQTLWYELFKNKLNAKIHFKEENVLDSRYNYISENQEKTNWTGQLRFTSWKMTGLEFVYENNREEESRYQSQIESVSYLLDIRNRLSTDLSLKTSLGYSIEKGEKRDKTNSYRIDAFQIEETVTYFIQRKYRLFARITYLRNDRSGSNYLGFLADKKDGNIFKWNLNFDYKVNSYTSARLVYSASSYPLEKDKHKLSLEVKAEF